MVLTSGLKPGQHHDPRHFGRAVQIITRHCGRQHHDVAHMAARSKRAAVQRHFQSGRSHGLVPQAP